MLLTQSAWRERREDVALTVFADLCSLRATLDKLGYPDMPLIFPPPHLCTGMSLAKPHIRAELSLTCPLSPHTQTTPL